MLHFNPVQGKLSLAFTVEEITNPCPDPSGDKSQNSTYSKTALATKLFPPYNILDKFDLNLHMACPLNITACMHVPNNSLLYLFTLITLLQCYTVIKSDIVVKLVT